MSNIVHDKYHRQNHHSFITTDIVDMGLDPIASKDHAFSGEFVMDNAAPDHETWLLSSDRSAFEWISAYGDTDTIKFCTNISGAENTTISYPSATFESVVISGGDTDAISLSVAGKTKFDVGVDIDGNINVVDISTGNIEITGNGGIRATGGLSMFGDVQVSNLSAIGKTTLIDDTTIKGELLVDSEKTTLKDLDVLGNLNVGNWITTVVGQGASTLNVNLDINASDNIVYAKEIITTEPPTTNVLNVRGDIDASGHTIYANTVITKREENINVLTGGGCLVSGSLSESIRKLIPGVDDGADNYVPGSRNLTLSAIGLSSDSWAAFTGNVLLDGNKVYDNADETIISGPIDFVGATGTSLNVNDAVIYKSNIHDMYFDSATGINLSATNLSANNSNLINVTGDTLKINGAADIQALTIGSLFDNNGIVTIGENGMSVASLTADNLTVTNAATLNINISAVNSELFGVAGTSAALFKQTEEDETSKAILNVDVINVSDHIITTTPLAQRDDVNIVPNIEFCDTEYLTKIPRLQADGWGFNTNVTYQIRDYNDNLIPDAVVEDGKVKNYNDILRWYNQARNRIWGCGRAKGGGAASVYKVALEFTIPKSVLLNFQYMEFCFDLLLLYDKTSTVANVTDEFRVKLVNDMQSLSSPIGYLRIQDMYGPKNCKKIREYTDSYGNMKYLRDQVFNHSRTRAKFRFVPAQYAIIEVLGNGMGPSNSSALTWFTL